MSYDQIEKTVCAEVKAAGWDVRDSRVVGSRYINDKTEGDLDVLVYAPGDLFEEAVRFAGWEFGGSSPMESDTWASLTKRIDGILVNLLLVTDRDYFERWATAAEVCRLVKLMQDRGLTIDARAARVAIHNIVMDDSYAEAEAELTLAEGFA